jgi:CMP-N-acetylneuraminic acid synthetase
MENPRADRRSSVSMEAAKSAWLETCHESEVAFANYLAGKSVVLVGPAASLTGRGQGADIDAHDVVIRMNLSCPTPPRSAVDLGSRTDVLYHVLFNPRLSRAAGQKHTAAQLDSWKADGVRFVVTRQEAGHDRVKRFRRILGDQFPLVVMSAEFKSGVRGPCGTNPNTGTLAIAHLLTMPIASLHVTGFDFYDSTYQVGYGGFSHARAAKGGGTGNWGLSEQVPHDQRGQITYLAAINDPRLTWDRLAAECLGHVERPPTVTALVPMKGQSERVPGKNVRDLCGKPLLFWTLDALHRSRRIGQVVVDTDDDHIAELVTDHHPETLVIRRPVRLRGGRVTGNRLTEWALTKLEGEHFLQTHCTNPLLTSNTIDRAIDAYFAGVNDHDSLFGVTEHHVRLYDADGVPVNHEPSQLARSQDLEPLYEDNSNLYVFSRRSFADAAGRIGRRPQMFPMSRLEAVDIDYEDDFELAEALMARRLA